MLFPFHVFCCYVSVFPGSLSAGTPAQMFGERALLLTGVISPSRYVGICLKIDHGRFTHLSQLPIKLVCP
jgi:hypothetical protein